ncbi:MAG TPA: ATP-binding protein [Chitinophagaceae bacterium]|nr:ATP-binding protein [Chitinophagaceae bacterium]
MKSLIKFLLFLLLPCSAIAQDTTITISSAIETSHYISLGRMDGWLFKKGHDTAWAKQDINLTGWQKLKPSELTEKLADKNGRLEGWLRIKIELDTAFRDTALELHMNVWAASEVYVDGKMLYTFGNTGVNGSPFKEYNPTYKLPVAFTVEKGKEHLLAIHFVDFLSTLPPYHLKSEGGFNSFVSIILPEFKTEYFNENLLFFFFRTLWLSVNVTLCLLFWLLAFQNRNEKNLLFIALASSIFALVIYCDQSIITPGISFNTYAFLHIAWSILLSVSAILCLLLMLRIFERKISRSYKIAFWILFISGITEIFLSSSYPFIFRLLLIIYLFAYTIIVSWKTLKGAQWSVLIGILLTWSFGLSLATAGLVAPGGSISLALLLATGIFLSFPLSLLVYVAIRFKEIINEVRDNAKQVVQLSEEKKRQALNQQKILQEEVNRQTAEIRTTLENLKSTQSQLIQSEKMASLGELTAGIAHEIQNPLNFVNNFSEVNSELIAEMKQEIDNGNLNEVKSLADNVDENEQKIIFHGKRADAIVKGMLQHSRSSSGIKEPTDINALADEYLRLAYHGLRAKDKSFNATTKTDFDNSIGNINIVPQDIGRVILNLITNAFYAVTEKNASLRTSEQANSAGQQYEPIVSVSTKKVNSKVEIKVKDNGNGIPQKVLDKIFQPFFTTKPTGQGTGLGLSLSYDIIKAHGGEIIVETNESEGAEFVIQLPINT